MPGRVSVVIPTLDEESSVGGAIRSVSEAAEVTVVDGGSRDRTREVAAAAGARVVSSPPSRGGQLRCGAASATGDWLVFLHADTRLEQGWAEALRAADPGVCGGAFRLAVDSPRASYRWIERAVALRTRLLHLPYGDQALFARRDAYLRAGGFAPLPLMEDVDFIRRLGLVGPLVFPAVRAFTSPRRWEREGILATTLSNWACLALYTAGCSPDRLAHWYGQGGHACP